MISYLDANCNFISILFRWGKNHVESVCSSMDLAENVLYIFVYCLWIQHPFEKEEISGSPHCFAHAWLTFSSHCCIRFVFPIHFVTLWKLKEDRLSIFLNRTRKVVGNEMLNWCGMTSWVSAEEIGNEKNWSNKHVSAKWLWGCNWRQSCAHGWLHLLAD